MKPTLAVYMFGYNLNRIAYPWHAAVESALALAGPKGAVFFCECFGDDKTFDDLIEMYKPQIKSGNLQVRRHHWADKHFKPEEIATEGYKIQAVIGNMLLDEIGHQYDFALKMDADEVLCEWTFDLFREQLETMSLIGAMLGRPRYVHFCPDDRHTFPFIYASKAVLSWTRSDLRFTMDKGGDACALGGAGETQTDLLVHHYGKMHMGRREQALYKENEFQKLYKDLGFPDPKVEALWNGDGYMDYTRVFVKDVEDMNFSVYDGPHPEFVKPWLAVMREKEERWWEEQKSNA